MQHVCSHARVATTRFLPEIVTGLNVISPYDHRRVLILLDCPPVSIEPSEIYPDTVPLLYRWGLYTLSLGPGEYSRGTKKRAFQEF